jgi:hypothetical protein
MGDCLLGCRPFWNGGRLTFKFKKKGGVVFPGREACELPVFQF